MSNFLKLTTSSGNTISIGTEEGSENAEITIPKQGGKVLTDSGTAVYLKEKIGNITDNILNLETGSFFALTITGNTTLSVINPPDIGEVATFILELTNAGSASVTWFENTNWAGGIAPTLTASGVDVLGFYTTDSGNTWRGVVLSKDSK